MKKAIFIFLIFIFIATFILNGCIHKKEEKINSGIYGIVTIGPITPVQKAGEINSRPYKTTIIVKSENGLKQIAEFNSGDDGSFKVYLKPGRYILESQKTSDPFPILKPMTVEVEENRFTEVNILFDTGIR